MFLRRFVLLLAVFVLVACGGPAAAPKGPDILQIGRADGQRDAAVASGGDDRPEGGDEDARVPVGKDDAIRGSRTAYVTVVVFSDFQCPFCRRLAPTLDRVREAYGSDVVRFVFKNQPLPFHEHAKLAAVVGQGVLVSRGPEAFWRYHDMAFRRQELISPDVIRQWGVAAGLDEREIDDGLSRGAWADKVERDVELGNRIGARGTPTSFINGTLVSGAQPFEKFKGIIDAELAKAKALEARGVARAKIYRESVAENFEQSEQKKPIDDDDDKNDTDTVWKVPVGRSPARGPATALVTIIEFSDFQCPFCKRVEPTLEKIRADYGARVRVVWKDQPLPFHPRAMPAAHLAREARAQKGDASFWDVHDRLFASQPKLEDSDLEDVARAAGLDVQKAKQAIAKETYKAQIEQDMDLADDFPATGTPHFFLNGRRLVGAQPYDKFKKIIDEEIRKAEALVRAGVAASALYETLTAGGKGAPELERKTVAASASAPFRGAANAPVVIQEFSDFQCPFCKRAEGTLDEILKRYPGKVKVVWRDLPLPIHANAPLAAEAGREAFAQKGNAGFHALRELMFGSQQSLTRDDLEGYAKTAGLDMARFNKALDDHRHKAAVDADAYAARAAGISSTPAFVINGYFLSGALPLAKFRKAIDRALAGPPPAPSAPSPAAPAAAATAGGLGVTDLAPGAGPAVKAGDTVSVHYTGTLADGTVFDSSKKRGQPFSFSVGKGVVIKGWDQGLVGMKIGGRRKLTIPPDLAYGDRGIPGTVPPKSTLVFEIELLSINFK